MIYIFIFILTLGDAALTLYGVATRQISEGNPLVAKLLDFNLIIGVVAIVALVGGLLYFISKQKFKWIKPACLGLIAVKVFIMFMHIDWLVK